MDGLIISKMNANSKNKRRAVYRMRVSKNKMASKKRKQRKQKGHENSRRHTLNEGDHWLR